VKRGRQIIRCIDVERSRILLEKERKITSTTKREAMLREEKADRLREMASNNYNEGLTTSRGE